jgi:hypothetical protein
MQTTRTFRMVHRHPRMWWKLLVLERREASILLPGCLKIGEYGVTGISNHCVVLFLFDLAVKLAAVVVVV